MKKSILLLIIIAGTSWLSGFTPDKSSSGAPPSHTGAPGELTCGTSGCHNDQTDNSGPAVLEFFAADSSQSYIPGQTYTFKARITNPGVERFGFQVVALDAATQMNAGTWTITDKSRTQVFKNYRQLTDRRYVTYTFDGTDAITPGIGEWTFNWTAPSVNTGLVTFYIAGVSANDDETDFGDEVYTTSFNFPAQ